MSDRVDEEYDERDRIGERVTDEVPAKQELARLDLPYDHMDYTTCATCGRRYRSGGSHTCRKS